MGAGESGVGAAILAQKKGFDICEILNSKIDKNEKKYPVEKSRGISTKYDKL